MKMDMEMFKLDLILVPLSLCISACYHAYIWQSYNAKEPVTSIAITLGRRITWLQDIVKVSMMMMMHYILEYFRGICVLNFGSFHTL